MNRETTLRDLTICGLFTALIAAGAFIQIPFPVLPVSMQVFFVTLSGLLLGKKYGTISVIIYVVLGLIGLPIFTQGGGIWYIMKPSFGYLLGFIAGAWLTGWLAQRANGGYRMYLAAGLAGVGVIYLIGVPYLYLMSTLYLNSDMTVRAAVVSGFLLTIPGDVACTFLAAYLCKRLRPLLDRGRQTA